MHWLGAKCSDVVGKRDSGIWEIRGQQIEHSFTNLLSLAGLDRWLNLIKSGKISKPSDSLISTGAKSKDLAISRIYAAATAGSVRNSPQDASFDASMLLMAPLRFPDLKLTQQTVTAIAKELGASSSEVDGTPHLLYRYRRVDDFGTPEDPFLICSFWLAHAYALQRQLDQARMIIEKTSKCANPLGLLAEHFYQSENSQLGNFPQTYSHVGLVNAAFAASPRWSEYL